MNIFIEEHRNLLKELPDSQTKFIVVGGYAVIFHGYGRTTGDMNIWLEPSDCNKEKFIPVIESKGFRKSDIKRLRESDFTTALAENY